MRRTVSRVAVAAVLGAASVAWGQPPPAGGPGAPEAKPGEAVPCGPKACVVEMKATKKVVHGSDCVEYCQPRSCLADFFRSCCGLGGRGCECGQLRTKNVLTKKTVPGPEVPVCVAKDVSALCPAPPVTVPGPKVGKQP